MSDEQPLEKSVQEQDPQDELEQGDTVGTHPDQLEGSPVEGAQPKDPVDGEAEGGVAPCAISEKSEDWPEHIPFSAPGMTMGKAEAAYRRRLRAASVPPQIPDALEAVSGLARRLPEPQRSMVMEMLARLRRERDGIEEMKAKLEAQKERAE